MFVPDVDDLIAVQDETMSSEDYRAAYLHLVAFRLKTKRVSIHPGSLLAETPLDPVAVAHGDSLLCACGVEEARAGRCHRTWAAGFLVLFGWEVVLDQHVLTEDEARIILTQKAVVASK